VTEARWGIVMTVMEPRALLLSNVAYHLATGAAEVHVYFDDPDDPLCDEVAALPGVVATRCDAWHWRRTAPIRARPDTIRRRQALNANHAQRRAGVDWLIHIDADEFLVQSRPLGHELAHVAELGCEIVFPVAERIFQRDRPQETFFDGLFRTSTKGLNRRADGVHNDRIIFGEHYPLLLHGVLGHSAGKCGVPVGQGYEIGIHWAYRGKGKERTRAMRYVSTSTTLLHFDGLTPLHWLGKLLRYADYDPQTLSIAPHRRAQIEIMVDIARDRAAILEFHREMKAFDAAGLDRLRGFGLLRETPFDPRPEIARVLGTCPDVHPAPFDAALLARNPERLAVLASG
jgi:hypothetical protein